MATVVNLGPGDEPIASAVKEHFASIGVIIDVLDLRGLIALLAGSCFFLGNDTGPTHIAAALGKKSVVIFGASDSRVWSPWRVEHRIVENAFPCQQCPQGRCESLGTSECILHVTVEQVREACEALLQESRGTPVSQRPRDDNNIP